MCGIAFVALLLLVAAWFATRPAPSLDVTITFVGYTNNWGLRHAALAITNRSDIAIKRFTKIWLIEDAETGLRTDCYDAVDGFPIPMPAYDGLEPGEGRITTVPVPTNQSPWRAVLWYCPVNLRLKLSEWRIRDYPGRRIVDAALPRTKIDGQEFRSDVISPQASPDTKVGNPAAP